MPAAFRPVSSVLGRVPGFGNELNLAFCELASRACACAERRREKIPLNGPRRWGWTNSPTLRLIALHHVPGAESNLSCITLRVAVLQAKQRVHAIDGGLHNRLHLLIRNVRVLRCGVAGGAKPPGMQVLNRAISENQGNQGFRFCGKFCIFGMCGHRKFAFLYYPAWRNPQLPEPSYVVESIAVRLRLCILARVGVAQQMQPWLVLKTVGHQGRKRADLNPRQAPIHESNVFKKRLTQETSCPYTVVEHVQIGPSLMTSQNNPGRVTEKAAETRSRILNVALDLFRRKGFEQATLREIAAEAGVSLGNAYYYFDSKEALVMAFYSRASDEMAPLIENALAEAKGFEKRVTAILSVKFEYFGPNRAFLGALLRHGADPQNPLSPFGEETRHIRERDMEYFAKALELSRIDVPKDLARCLPKLLWLYQMGLILFWIYDHSDGQQRTAQLRDKSLGLMATALKLAGFPLLRPLRKKLIELVRIAEGEQADA